MLRGGSWNNNANRVRSAYRNNNTPDNRNNNVGFRCARSPSAVSAGPECVGETRLPAVGSSRACLDGERRPPPSVPWPGRAKTEEPGVPSGLIRRGAGHLFRLPASQGADLPVAQQVRVDDIDYLRAFRDRLVSYNQTLQQEHERIRQAWRDQQSNWHDPQADHLNGELESLWRGIEAYLKTTADHERYLQRLLEHLDNAGSLRL